MLLRTIQLPSLSQDDTCTHFGSNGSVSVDVVVDFGIVIKEKPLERRRKERDGSIKKCRIYMVASPRALLIPAARRRARVLHRELSYDLPE